MLYDAPGRRVQTSTSPDSSVRVVSLPPVLPITAVLDCASVPPIMPQLFSLAALGVVWGRWAWA